MVRDNLMGVLCLPFSTTSVRHGFVVAEHFHPYLPKCGIPVLMFLLWCRHPGCLLTVFCIVKYRSDLSAAKCKSSVDVSNLRDSS